MPLADNVRFEVLLHAMPVRIDRAECPRACPHDAVLCLIDAEAREVAWTNKPLRERPCVAEHLTRWPALRLESLSDCSIFAVSEVRIAACHVGEPIDLFLQSRHVFVLKWRYDNRPLRCFSFRLAAKCFNDSRNKTHSESS